jgi:hypothetical protein
VIALAKFVVEGGSSVENVVDVIVGDERFRGDGVRVGAGCLQLLDEGVDGGAGGDRFRHLLRRHAGMEPEQVQSVVGAGLGFTVEGAGLAVAASGESVTVSLLFQDSLWLLP